MSLIKHVQELAQLYDEIGYYKLLVELAQKNLREFQGASGREIHLGLPLRYGQVPYLSAEDAGGLERVQLQIKYSDERPINAARFSIKEVYEKDTMKYVLEKTTEPDEDLRMEILLEVLPQYDSRGGRGGLRIIPDQTAQPLKLEDTIKSQWRVYLYDAKRSGKDTLYSPKHISHQVLEEVCNFDSTNTIQFWDYLGIDFASKPIAWKMNYINRALTEFFQLKGYEPTSVDIGQCFREAKESVLSRKQSAESMQDSLQQRIEGINVLNFTEQDVLSLANYLEKLPSALATYSSLRQMHGDNPELDPLVDLVNELSIPRTCSHALDNVRAYTNGLSIAVNQGDNPLVFRKLRAIFLELMNMERRVSGTADESQSSSEENMLVVYTGLFQ